jgi:hypothetical protein
MKLGGKLAMQTGIHNATCLTRAPYPFLGSGTGRHAIADSTSAFDEFTSWSISLTLHTGNHSLRPSGWVPFSCRGVSGSDHSGFYIWTYGNNWFFIMGDGSGSATVHTMVATSAYKRTFGSNKASPYTTIVFTADASSTSNNIKIYQFNSSEVSGSNNFAEVQTFSQTYTNWGTIGTSNNVVISADKLGSGSVTNDNEYSDIGVSRVQLFDEALSSTNAHKIAGITEGGENSHKTQLRDYSDGGYTRPIHEWIPALGVNGDSSQAATHIYDTGSATALNLELKGTITAAYGPRP